MAQEQVFLQVLHYFPVNTPLMLHRHCVISAANNVSKQHFMQVFIVTPAGIQSAGNDAVSADVPEVTS